MPRLQTLKPRVPTLELSRATRVAPAPAAYGQGRGGRPWRRLVEAVKVRDRYTCQMCGRVTTEGAADHVIPCSQGGTDDLWNLQWLCNEPCHSEKSKAEAKGR